MRFFKDCEGLCFFFSVHLIFFIQIYLVYNVEDKDVNIILFLHKLIFCIIMFLTFFSHFQIAQTDPGIIDYYNNIDMIEFYYFVYKDIISLREEYNLKYKGIKDDNRDNYYSSDEEEKEIELKSEISDKMKNIISKKFKIHFTRCKSCYVVRPYDAHHCRTCHCCILEQDHHCPWINNCVGIFNKKYFILFNIYAFISVIYCSFIYYYYTIIVNYKNFVNNVVQNIIAICWGIFAFIYGLFVIIMAAEQRDSVKKEFKKYWKDKEIQKQMIKIKMRIIFGRNFSFKWFLPFYEGGKRYIYFFLRQKKMELYLKQKELKRKEVKENVNDNNNNYNANINKNEE